MKTRGEERIDRQEIIVAPPATADSLFDLHSLYRSFKANLTLEKDSQTSRIQLKDTRAVALRGGSLRHRRER